MDSKIIGDIHIRMQIQTDIRVNFGEMNICAKHFGIIVVPYCIRKYKEPNLFSGMNICGVPK